MRRYGLNPLNWTRQVDMILSLSYTSIYYYIEPSSSFELFVASNGRGTLLAKGLEDATSMNTNIVFPTALDKKNRWVYYLDTCSSEFTCIYRSSIPFLPNAQVK